MTIKVKIENTGHLPVHLRRAGGRLEARLAPGDAWEGHVWQGAGIEVMEPAEEMPGWEEAKDGVQGSSG